MFPVWVSNLLTSPFSDGSHVAVVISFKATFSIPRDRAPRTPGLRPCVFHLAEAAMILPAALHKFLVRKKNFRYFITSMLKSLVILAMWLVLSVSIYNGNWTERSAIWSEIIRVISKSNEQAARVRFEIRSMISEQNCTTRSSITTLLDPFWNRTILWP